MCFSGFSFSRSVFKLQSFSDPFRASGSPPGYPRARSRFLQRSLLSYAADKNRKLKKKNQLCAGLAHQQLQYLPRQVLQSNPVVISLSATITPQECTFHLPIPCLMITRPDYRSFSGSPDIASHSLSVLLHGPATNGVHNFFWRAPEYFLVHASAAINGFRLVFIYL